MESLLTDKKKYFMSVIFDNFGSSLMTFAIPIYILGLSNSVLYLSLVSSLALLPFLVLGMPFGALVDKINIKKILYLSDFIRLFLYFALFFICSLPVFPVQLTEETAFSSLYIISSFVVD